MTKILQESYLKASELPEDEQDRIGRTVMQIVNSIPTYEQVQEPHQNVIAGRRWGFGCLKGLITVPDDFDATPEDFKDYL